MRECWHELPPGQCGVCTPPTPDIALNRAAVLREYGEVTIAPQVEATIVALPTTATLPQRGYGGQLPRIPYGHWGVQTTTSEDVERAREARARARLVALLQSYDDERVRIAA